jgi:hypothetical protein
VLLGVHYNLEIYDVHGEKVHSTVDLIQQTSNGIDLSNFAKGIYFVRLLTDDRSHACEKKIVVQ